MVGGTWIWRWKINNVGWEGNHFFQTMASCIYWSELAHKANMNRSTIRDLQHRIPITIQFKRVYLQYTSTLIKTTLTLNEHTMFNDYALKYLLLRPYFPEAFHYRKVFKFISTFRNCLNWLWNSKWPKPQSWNAPLVTQIRKWMYYHWLCVLKILYYSIDDW